MQSIAGTTYDANTGSFGDVGFGGGDEAQSSGPHGYQLVLTSSYEASSQTHQRAAAFSLTTKSSMPQWHFTCLSLIRSTDRQ